MSLCRGDGCLSLKMASMITVFQGIKTGLKRELLLYRMLKMDVVAAGHSVQLQLLRVWLTSTGMMRSFKSTQCNLYLIATKKNGVVSTLDVLVGGCLKGSCM